VADRVAWGEASVVVAPELQGLVDDLVAARAPVELPSQLVHGDLAGNVLFADGQAPAVIDFSPYWRPAGYALAVAAVDVLVWPAAPPSILDALDSEERRDQLLLRALLHRLVAESLGPPDPESGRRCMTRPSRWWTWSWPGYRVAAPAGCRTTPYSGPSSRPAP
jgi:uncharacterized protein (TIGR02569 family)